MAVLGAVRVQRLFRLVEPDLQVGKLRIDELQRPLGLLRLALDVLADVGGRERIERGDDPRHVRPGRLHADDARLLSLLGDDQLFLKPLDGLLRRPLDQGELRTGTRAELGDEDGKAPRFGRLADEALEDLLILGAEQPIAAALARDQQQPLVLHVGRNRQPIDRDALAAPAIAAKAEEWRGRIRPLVASRNGSADDREMPGARHHVERELLHDAFHQRARAQDLDLGLGRAVGREDRGEILDACDALLLFLDLQQRIGAVDGRGEPGVEQARDDCGHRDGADQPARSDQRLQVVVQAGPVLAFLELRRLDQRGGRLDWHEALLRLVHRYLITVYVSQSACTVGRICPTTRLKRPN